MAGFAFLALQPTKIHKRRKSQKALHMIIHGLFFALLQIWNLGAAKFSSFFTSHSFSFMGALFQRFIFCLKYSTKTNEDGFFSYSNLTTFWLFMWWSVHYSRISHSHKIGFLQSTVKFVDQLRRQKRKDQKIGCRLVKEKCIWKMAKPSLRVRRHLPAMPFTNVLQMESSYFSTTSSLTPQWVEISAQWGNPTLNVIFNFVSARISL